MVVVSEPGACIVGGGDNAKYVRECTEIFLAKKGIEKIRGFEPYVNLQSLWLNGNKLKKINNLDGNSRIKALYVHDNQICTLKGSLLSFRFLETLDLSNNQLRDLDKLVKTLERFQFLKTLNLSGNPCCEEPDYRLTVIHHIPSLSVLDLHSITPQERRKAKAAFTGEAQTLGVAFLKRAPPYDPDWDEKVPTRSLLEQELIKEAATIKDSAAVKALEAETALFRHNPYPDIIKGKTLPPNAGVRQSMAAFEGASHMSTLDGRAKRGASRSGIQRLPPSLAPALEFTAASPFAVPRTLRESAPKHSSAAGFQSSSPSAFSMVQLTGHSSPPSAPHPLEANSPYSPKDVLVMYSCRPGQSDLIQGLTRPSFFGSGHLSGQGKDSIRFDQGTYAEWVKQRVCGREAWQIAKNEVKI